MGRAAAPRVLEHFSWSRIAELTLEFYNELLEQPTRSVLE